MGKKGVSNMSLLCDNCSEEIIMCSNCNKEFKSGDFIYCDYNESEHYCSKLCYFEKFDSLSEANVIDGDEDEEE